MAKLTDQSTTQEMADAICHVFAGQGKEKESLGAAFRDAILRNITSQKRSHALAPWERVEHWRTASSDDMQFLQEIGHGRRKFLHEFLIEQGFTPAWVPEPGPVPKTRTKKSSIVRKMKISSLSPDSSLQDVIAVFQALASTKNHTSQLIYLKRKLEDRNLHVLQDLFGLDLQGTTPATGLLQAFTDFVEETRIFFGKSRPAGIGGGSGPGGRGSL